jgi:hypothetical protein
MINVIPDPEEAVEEDESVGMGQAGPPRGFAVPTLHRRVLDASSAAVNNEVSGTGM